MRFPPPLTHVRYFESLAGRCWLSVRIRWQVPTITIQTPAEGHSESAESHLSKPRHTPTQIHKRLSTHSAESPMIRLLEVERITNLFTCRDAQHQSKVTDQRAQRQLVRFAVTKINAAAGPTGVVAHTAPPAILLASALVRPLAEATAEVAPRQAVAALAGLSPVRQLFTPRQKFNHLLPSARVLSAGQTNPT